jgi:predicted dehydrogenase
MPNDHRFVVVGSGSAGRRHALALRTLYPTAFISIVRRSGSRQPLEALERAGVTILSSLESGSETNPDLVVIASPSTRHLEDFAHFVKCRSRPRVLLEKPLASSSEDGRKILELATLYNTDVTVGYHLRYSETPIAFETELESHSMHTVQSFSFSYGHHLRLWRPEIQAESSVTARRDLGGGVLRELSHEIDASLWLCGEPLHVQHSSLRFDGAPTDGVVETSADFVLAGARVDANIHLDMVTDVPYRHWIANFPEFSIRADLLTGCVEKLSDGGRSAVLHQSGPNERDRAAQELLSSVVTGNGTPPARPCGIPLALRILDTIEAVEKSARTHAVSELRIR